MIIECGLNKTDLVLAAVSGGADSLSLLHFLHESGYPLLVCHFNHQLRPEADADAAFVRNMAKSLGLPFVSDSADVAAYAEAQGQSIEEAARELRYRFLFREAHQAKAQAVATGHTADDQAETVLMHFLRGAGLSGLKGMPARLILPTFDTEIPLVRPLLGWTRAQTEAYCRQHNLDYLTDSTNVDTNYLRNKLRHELLPQLENYNPQIRQSLAKSALALQGDYQLLNELIESVWQKNTQTGSGFVAFDLPCLQEMSLALRRNLFRKAAFALKPGLRDVNFYALERAASLKPVDVAGKLKTIVEKNILYLAEDESLLPVTDWPQIDHELELANGQYGIGNGWYLTCETLPVDHSPISSDIFTACFDADLTVDRLWLRTFRTGDRLEQLGMPRQTVKLKDLFVNQKVPKRIRNNWPLLCINDEIAWVTGLRMSERFKVTATTRSIVQLRLQRNQNQKLPPT